MSSQVLFFFVAVLEIMSSLYSSASIILGEEKSFPDSNLTSFITGQTDEIMPRQIGFPTNPLKPVRDRLPCECNNGICKCCTASLLQTIGLKGCFEILYIPEDFAFELRMKMNNLVLYKNKVSGKNPPPICVRPPRYGLLKVCVTFYDVFFYGQNMHVCMDVGGFFQGLEVYNRSFDCLRFGDKGVKIVKPEDSGFPSRPTDVEIDQGDDDEIEDYDENVVRNISL